MNGDRVGDVVAVGAVASPWWLPILYEVSTIAGLLLPILGCVWLILQAIVFIQKHRVEK